MVQPRKQFAQHWLKSEKALDAIVKAAQCREGDRILEIGPGTGILTRRLLPLAKSLVAVEIDRDLCKLLVKQLGQKENFLLLQGDFLTLDVPSQLLAFNNFQKQNKVVANIPYNITGPIIEKLLGTITQPNPEPYDSIVLLVQKEVAERLYAKPGSRTFGALSVRVQYLADCELICTVPASAFHPPPKVDSAVVRLLPRQIEIPANSPKKLENLVKLGFGAKRKMLRNNLQSVIDRDLLTQLLEQLGINPQVRAEDLSVAQWVNLSNCLTFE
ncbi:16S rRNA (adenine(1518)-N(6)/adenine(1519)-N(6))-dimethyltransferase RsmA [Anabaena cylindrica FACHB-243]|uniref:Ribosomal RNA small subunit methyltransferase A n=1 Tax=Anabaena cylindrica (strain ATCC 27899 / PCC 7122) TaxID=272123 RepID=K9ZAM5_ANACC|nr:MULTISPECIES: 16S rRNA (adenine(1518)-N(6)/adenine(1519)-N(6))-dimethyltransferase RsmA [Anabaena]AFZ56238.1 dimethyladenosine transferase [Anabaena cylindrica PCC 7122]MBD2417465.1 16S rRNA (adenine(1518)-N(6)/adenine(1519)-N(6))-dimethyltransferase RsmA [Anabaena cylindrica FACHB-243]MBY5285632.1 16S rRNA (adenine(1518)-N(6)/adenine(1519)-N(6))-dimethyltransferase RsmA [Anabaena sp. CCAP 1446/1C]MBY5310958.1 16S rRNA (adenine(1518)-N(6)/adenine(1519)-N(6))-dimethyltransferase RsmA [Anabaen